MDIVFKKFSEQAEQSRKMYAASQIQGGVALAEVAAGFGLTLHGLPGADGRPPKGVLKRVKKIPERIEKACKKGARSPLAFGAGLVLSTYGVVDAYLSINEIKDWQALAKKDQTEAVLAEIELAKVKTDLQMAHEKLRLCLSQPRIFVTP